MTSASAKADESDPLPPSRDEVPGHLVVPAFVRFDGHP